MPPIRGKAVAITGGHSPTNPHRHRRAGGIAAPGESEGAMKRRAQIGASILFLRWQKKAPGQGGLTERRKRGSCATSGGAEQTAGGSADRFSR